MIRLKMVLKNDLVYSEQTLVYTVEADAYEETYPEVREQLENMIPALLLAAGYSAALVLVDEEAESDSGWVTAHGAAQDF